MVGFAVISGGAARAVIVLIWKGNQGAAPRLAFPLQVPLTPALAECHLSGGLTCESAFKRRKNLSASLYRLFCLQEDGRTVGKQCYRLSLPCSLLRSFGSLPSGCNCSK